MAMPYVQFSKRMTVVAVVAAVVIAIGTEVILCLMGYPEGVVQVAQSFLLFAGLVFAAYCGNSAVEKWALARLSVSGVQLRSTGAVSYDNVG